MAFKVTGIHWDIIINFMELHPDLARGRINGPSGKDTFKKLWTELTLELNATGLGERPIQKWQKTWTDFKYALKKKASDIKADISGTGGGPAKGGNLTEFENRILNLLGKTFHEGLGREENGCSFMIPNIEQKTSQEQQAERKTKQNETNVKNYQIPENSFTDSLQEYRGIHNVSSRTSGFGDHDYIQQPSSSITRRVNPEREMEMLYKETLSELKTINSTLKDISNSGRGIQESLDKIAEAFAVFLSNDKTQINKQ